MRYLAVDAGQSLYLDKDFSILDVAENFSTLTGHSPEIINTNFLNLIHRDYLDSFRNIFISDKRQFINLFIKKQDGLWLYCAVYSSPKDNNRSLYIEEVNAHTAFGDIKDKIENSFSHLWKNMFDIYYRADNFGNITSISPSIEIFSGFSCEEMIGRNLAEEFYVYPDMREDFKAQLMESGSVQAFDCPLFRKDGTVWWVSTSAHFLKNRKSEVIGVEGIGRDITDRKEAQDKLLRDTEKRYRSLFENSSDAIIITDIQTGRIIDANPKAYELTMIEKDGLTGLCIDDIFDENMKERVFKKLEKLKKFKSSQSPVELNIIRRDGLVTPVEATSFLIYEGADKFAVNVLRDISTVAMFEQQQKENEHMLIQQSKLASMGEMLGNIAHQWRQPLARLAGAALKLRYSQKEDTAPPEIIGSITDEIETTVNYMSRTIDNFKNFFVPSASDTLFNIKEAVDCAVEIISPVYIECGIALSIDIDDSLHAYGNENEFSHVILNILQNSKDAAVERNIAGAEVTVCSEAGENIILHIRDNAGGISGFEVERIFEPYFTTKPKSEGAGIGLYMSMMIMQKKMNGTLTAANTGDGLAFKIELPGRGE